MKKIHVSASKEYDILIENGLLSTAGPIIREAVGAGCTAAIVSDDRVFPLYGGILKETLESAGFSVLPFVFPHGEPSKNLQTYGELLEFLCENHVTRKDFIVALGGGVVGDLSGFAAATYQRGIAYVQIPTTLLACVDSSVGGKTAVDLKAGKNQAGCFYQPSLVLADPDTLATLPEEEYRCGCAEVIKYAVLDNADFYDELMKTDVRDMYDHVIFTCAGMKRDIVERDEFDTGERMLLNFGHTFGHAVENCSSYSILHGQAVAMGMAAMARSAAQHGICGLETVEQILTILNKYSLPSEIPYSADEMLTAALSDKKMAGHQIRLVVPEKIGKCRTQTIDAAELKEWMLSGGIR